MMAEAGPCVERATNGEGETGPAKAVYKGTNSVPRAAGRVTHLGLADGELADRVVVVGSVARAHLIAEFLEPEVPGGELFVVTSDRGFTTYTGLYAGRRVSVVSIGMGLAMMDFFVREGRSVVEGPMHIVRYGTCGVVKADVKVGAISVATEGSVLLQRNYAAFAHSSLEGTEPYILSEVCPADHALSDEVVKALTNEVGAESVVLGLNASADSFYGSQGRVDPHFRDDNVDVVDKATERHPSLVTFEMETFQLLHLAACCHPEAPIKAAAAVINVANRHTGAVVDGERLKALERDGGKAILAALAAIE